jgi:hypothetical protein
MHFLVAILSIFNSPLEPLAQVHAGGSDIEAVFVPAGFEGPVVALPLDVEVF